LSKKTHLKLLLADDENLITNMYELGLPRCFGDTGSESTSVSVTVCSQGQDAVELFEEARRSGEPFDVIILDVRMPPGIGGVEAAKEIRSSDKEVPIIFLSGYSDVSIPNLEERVPPASRMCYVEKPIQLSELADLILEMASV